MRVSYKTPVREQMEAACRTAKQEGKIIEQFILNPAEYKEFTCGSVGGVWRYYDIPVVEGKEAETKEQLTKYKILWEHDNNHNKKYLITPLPPEYEPEAWELRL